MSDPASVDELFPVVRGCDPVTAHGRPGPSIVNTGDGLTSGGRNGATTTHGEPKCCPAARRESWPHSES